MVVNHQAPYTLSMFLMFVMTACMFNILSSKQVYSMNLKMQFQLKAYIQEVKNERRKSKEKQIAIQLGYGMPAKITKNKTPTK